MVAIPGFEGLVYEPADGGYEDVRAIWNAMIDRKPAIIARCTRPGDVVAALRYARERDLVVSVRGGGHQVSGNALCDGGLTIDLSPMKAVRVEPDARRAHAQAGVLWGELDQATQEHGLAVTGGVVTHTGIAGLTLGGGIGWLMRKHGLTIDSLASVRIVTADGQLLRASDDENPDLFWGVRGGGGNFGIVTEFEYRLHSVGPTVLAGPIFWPMEDAPELLRFYRDFVRGVPDDLTTVLNLRQAPPLAVVPAELHGRPVCAVVTCWAGSIEEGERVLRPLRAFGKPLLDLAAPKPYLAHQSTFDPVVPHGLNWYWKTHETGELKDDAIDRIVEHSTRITSPISYTVIFHLGGAIARVPDDATAYAHRDAAHAVNINAGWETGDPGAERHMEWARRFHEDLEAHRIGVYVNFLGDEGDERVREAYGEAKYRRLQELKGRYDPANVFRLNQNIRPPDR